MRLAIAAILFISVFAMMRNISSTWRENRLPVPVVAKKTGGIVAPGTASPVGISKSLTPSSLPDLKVGYLFNADRLLVGEEGKNVHNLAAGNDLGIQADIKTVTYSGSIIGDSLKQAIIVVPGVKQSRASKTRSVRRRKTSSRQKNIQNVLVKEGDLLSGYTVASISAERIIFEKGNEKIVKLLYDPHKKRTSPTRQARISRRSAARSEFVARPAGTPPAVRSSIIRRQITRSVRPASGRRLVVPRRPPAKPNTSRVARRGRRGSSLPVATPPMPMIRH